MRGFGSGGVLEEHQHNSLPPPAAAMADNVRRLWDETGL
jgi:hypothetical protein